MSGPRALADRFPMPVTAGLPLGWPYGMVWISCRFISSRMDRGGIGPSSNPNWCLPRKGMLTARPDSSPIGLMNARMLGSVSGLVTGTGYPCWTGRRQITHRPRRIRNKRLPDSVTNKKGTTEYGVPFLSGYGAEPYAVSVGIKARP